MAFSGALTLTDLNDFISPSQACIKPVEQVNKPEVVASGAKTEIVVDATGGYYEVDNTTGLSVDLNTSSSAPSAGQKLEQAQINLNDCLACSGCITSAESVLITLQSHAEVFKFVDENRVAAVNEQKILVLSIAPQALASLSASLSTITPVTPSQVLRRVRAFAQQHLDCASVFDTTFARHIALNEHLLEFEERRARDAKGGEEAEGQLPMLASACPGWICYAEKAHAEMLPFVSRTKSPQQIMGTLVKEWMAKRWGKTPDRVYHVSVMPCYDKKLEASRQDFYNEVYATRDVDCVITTGELDLMMKERRFDASIPVTGELLSPLPNPEEGRIEIQLPDLVPHPGSSSGSYLQSIIDHIRRTSPAPLTLSSKQMRNADYEEVTLTDEATGRLVFKGAKCYGFRNLQNVVRKVGRDKGVRVGGGAAGKLGGRAVGRKVGRKGAAGGGEGGNRQYDYVEVMACPSGCVNGGGQLKPVISAQAPDGTTNANGAKDEEGFSRNWEESGVMQSSAKWGDKEWTRRVEEAYWTPVPGYPPSSSGTRLAGGGEEPRRQQQQHEEGDGRKESESIEMSSTGGATSEMKNGLGRHHQSNGELAEEAKEALLKPDEGGLGRRGDGSHDPLGKDMSSGQVTCKRGDVDGGGLDLDRGNRVKTVKNSRRRGDDDEDDGMGLDGLEPGTWLFQVQALADRILKEMMCSGQEGKEEAAEGDEERQSRRHRFLRTQYHAVESEVIGLAVKW